MECPTFSKYSWLDFVFTVIGVCTFLFDVGSDLWVAKEFYTRGDFVWFGLVLGFMLLSSVIIQMFSWFWLQYDRDLEDFEPQASAGNIVLFGGAKRVKLSLFLHVCQLGFFVRHISAIWQGFRVWWRGGSGSEYAVYLTHDLSMLRLIETFCESAPQLTLMTYIMLHCNHARIVQCVSVVASTTSIAWMVVDYHRSLRSFLPDKDKQGWTSAVVYFLWNLFLIGPRVASVALFASVLPCYIAAHFLSLWPVFLLWAWRQGTDFMDSTMGEWLYRATIGLIWYFSWFNVAEGHTRGRSVIYHAFMITDSGILLVAWWFYRDAELTQSYGLILIITIPLVYVLGLLIKVLYYCCFHPKLWRQMELGKAADDVSDAAVTFKAVQTDGAAFQVLNKRMGKHAANFYTSETSSAVKSNGCEARNVSVL
ncbi:XK-related protein 8.3 [Myxocyprinus asiaticus]|uniref:XK-related protein 8.3 n=1 Tax=Myxocyprinus asiaticus TaxID=70543 RepID=UPI002222DF55|nr:XK-related protein 8.3 [Myxocyprinus asiaticus]